jgi:tetratricopeptide (TPR) repeat protein
MPRSLPRLYLNHITAFDWLIALEFGRVDDGQPEEQWLGVSDDFSFLRDAPDGCIVGFKVKEYSTFDVEHPDVQQIWTLAQFEVPLLGLRRATAGEIILASRQLIGPHCTVNRAYFDGAIEAAEDPEEALGLWLACLQSGDSMAHFALGYTLYELHRYREAYRHLRHYSEIAPNSAWAWCWLGRGAEAIGEVDEARAAYRRSIELDDDDVTEATDLLAALDEHDRSHGTS